MGIVSENCEQNLIVGAIQLAGPIRRIVRVKAPTEMEQLTPCAINDKAHYLRSSPLGVHAPY